MLETIAATIVLVIMLISFFIIEKRLARTPNKRTKVITARDIIEMKKKK